MKKHWLQYVGIRAAIIIAVGGVIVKGLDIWNDRSELKQSNVNYKNEIKEKDSRITNLQQQLSQKDFEIQRLETQLTPFKTIALERYSGTETEALSKLALRINELESSLNTIKDYSSVAKLNIFGLPFQSSKSITFSSPLSKALEGCYKVIDGNVSPVFTPESEKKFLDVIERFPDFPFSYYGLAKYYKEIGNPDWKSYAEKAINIFDQTTQIKGHNSQHDEAKRNLMIDLSQN